VLLAFFVSPGDLSEKRSLFSVVVILAIIFFLLGAALVYLSWESKLEKKLKVFLILTGASAIGFPVFVILHNFFYALGVLAGNIVVLKSIMEFLHAAFFLIGLIGCPIGFLIGAIGSIVKFNRK